MLIANRHPFKQAASWLVCGWALTAGNARADNDWLTMSGDGEMPLKTAQNLIQVSPQSIQGSGDLRSMNVRVHHIEQRNNWDGVPYRSYVGTVEFDCAQKTARHAVINYYLTPVWSGPVHQTVTYPPSQPRMMAFRDVVPNPLERIIKAACMSKHVLSN